MDFRSIRIHLASPEEILSWSYGEVLKPETINYRTQKAERDGLFSEAIFGPEHDFHCYCGKYRRIRYKGIICDKCGVEVTRSIVRRERMGHIKLASPVTHIWFLRGVPSRIALLLDVSLPELEHVVYFASYIITDVNEEAKTEAMKKLENEFRSRIKEVQSEEERQKIREMKEQEKPTLKSIRKHQILSELEYRELSLKYGEVFRAGIGAEAIKKLLEQSDLEKMITETKEQIRMSHTPIQRKKITRKLKLLQGLQRAGIRPEWMVLSVIPVIPPALRPMVQLDGGRFATSDLNDLYRRVINRNNRLKQLIELKAPEVIARNEKRMLQEAVDALIDNTMRRGQTLTTASTGQKRALKSLADVLKGKQGRFRQNLLGKRVDYSGRSVIVIGPELKIDECGLPKTMALELFKPFVVHNLIKKGLAHNIRSANRLIDELIPEVWEALEEAISDKLVLLNRAPTLHRLGVQAFKPMLHEGKAVRIPALPTRAFNADFDGDQMAVHLPITEDAQWEARNLMLASKGVLKPATGRPIATPENDAVLGCYYLTGTTKGMHGEGKSFSSEHEARLALEHGIIKLRAEIKVRLNKMVEDSASKEQKKTGFVVTSVGRIIFNAILPDDMPFINKKLVKRDLHLIEERILENYPEPVVIDFLNKIVKLGFHYATVSGLSWAMGDVTTPPEKKEVLRRANLKVFENRQLYEQGLLTERERRTRAIEIWTKAKSTLSKYVKDSIDRESSVYIMVDSKARGNWPVVDQLMGMMGLVVNPRGQIIELPIKSSLIEGLNVLEYFISTHGARKGLADTALRTATAGYLTRRLVDVAQDVVVTEEDCKDKEGLFIYAVDGKGTDESLGDRSWGRVALESIKDEQGNILVKKGNMITKEQATHIDIANLEKIKIRSLVTCKTRNGVCRMCYGYDLGRNTLVELGEAVGIVTAQAIGEPGTQLTMRTFHTGGVAGGGDITMGLPRVEEIFEARIPRSPAVVSDVSGRVLDVVEQNNQKLVRVKADDTGEEREYILPLLTSSWVEKGDLVTPGQQLSEGHLDLKELFKLTGGSKNEVVRYVTSQIKSIYFSAGEGLHDKHMELIIRQMFSRVRIVEAGDTTLLNGNITELGYVLNENDRIKKEGGKPAAYEQLLLGITRVSLTTESFLSAASFQETARVLIEAATTGKIDVLRGLKENVIIGRLIPAGTGFRSKTKKE